MEKIHENVHVLCFHVYFKHESTKHACFRVNFHLVPTFPSLHHKGKGSIPGTRYQVLYIILLCCNGVTGVSIKEHEKRSVLMLFSCNNVPVCLFSRTSCFCTAVKITFLPATSLPFSSHSRRDLRSHSPERHHLRLPGDRGRGPSLRHQAGSLSD